MDPVKESRSPSIQMNINSDRGMRDRRGVDDRQVVLQQLQNATVIDLDSDADDSMALPEPASAAQTSSIDAKGDVVPGAPTQYPKQNAIDTSQSHTRSQVTRKRLFVSGDKLLGDKLPSSPSILTPPSSAHVSPNSSFDFAASAQSLYTSSLDQLGLDSGGLRGAATIDAAEPDVDIEHLLSIYNSGDADDDAPGSPAPALDAPSVARSAAEARGIAKSQQLHAQRKFRSQEDPEPVQSIDEEQKRRDARLARITASALGKPMKSVLKDGGSKKPAKRVQFHAPEMANPAKKARKPVQPQITMASNDIRTLMGISSKPSIATETSEGARPTLSGLSQLTQDRIDHGSQKQKNDTSGLYPEQGLPEYLTLPKGFEAMESVRKSLIIQRETASERLRDLSAIQGCFEHFAKLLSYGALLGSNATELRELKTFTQKVLEDECTGKLNRQRINEVRENVKRRLSKIDTDALPNGAVEDRLSDILRQDYWEKLQVEVPKLRSESDRLKALCSQKNTKTCIRGGCQGNLKAKKTTASLRATGTKKDGPLAAQIRAQLTKFKAAEERDGEEAVLEIDIPDRGDDYTSEEEEGDEFLYAPKRTDLESKDIAGNAEDSESQMRLLPVQAADQSLLERMVTTTQQREHANRQGAQKPDSQMLQDMKARESARAAMKQKPADVDATSEDIEIEEVDLSPSAEFNDSDLEDDVEDHNEVQIEGEIGRPECYRYLVYSHIHGHPSMNGQHLIDRFLNRAKAIKEVLKVAPQVRKDILNLDSNAPQEYTITLKQNETEYEQQLAMGEDGDVGCRTWIERERYNPSEEAYNNVKVKKACRGPNVWSVDWEKIISPIIEEAAHKDTDISSKLALNTSEPTLDDILDDLFEPDTELPGCAQAVPEKGFQPITERATQDHQRLFTSIAYANRHASEVFMTFVITHLSSPGDIAYITTINNDIEEQLERCSDLHCWMREDSFVTERKGLGKVNESMRIWVRKCQTTGPSN
ncbi:hypothetical protein LTR05_006331 [Lithohypha guttulata]|uniref:Uncharacterized protein n=1 Tax=Lithohypha guttulata TaxID=1690604 RepID=A0AAN7SY75_9EURO|nr:hypothetical protein LTR05_006331 [Lithohypha guttulata]